MSRKPSCILLSAVLLSLFLVFFCVPPAAVQAAEKEDKATGEEAVAEKKDQEEQRYYPLGEVVVTSTETENTVAELPQTVTVVAQDLIEDTASPYLTETFQMVPGVSVNDYNSSGFGHQLHVRGYDYGRTYNCLDLQVEGVSVHSAGDWNNHVLNAIPKSAIDQIEFLKGTGTAMYGSHASIGVINTTLKRPFGDPSGEVTIGYGSYNQILTSAGFTGSYENFGLNFAADYAAGDSYHDHQSYDKLSVVIAPTLRLGTNTTIEMTLLHGEHNIDNPQYTYLSAEDAAEDRRQNFDCGTQEANVTYVGASLIHDFSDTVTWVTKAGYYKEKENQDLTSDDSRSYFYGYDYVARRPMDSYDLRSYVSVSDLGTPGSILTAGVQYHFDKSSSRSNWGGAMDTDAKAEISNIAVFGQYELRLLNALTISMGIRGDYYSTDLDNYLDTSLSYSGNEMWAVSPRVGLNLEIIKGVNLFTNFSTGFRPPTAYELAFESSLDPEKSLNYEVGIKARPVKFWETILSLYRNDYTNLIVNFYATDSDFGSSQNIYSNSGKATYQGIEWANYFNFGHGFFGYGHLLLDDSHYDEWKSGENADYPYDYSGNKTPYCPHTQVKFGFKYANYGWDIGFDARYYGDYYADNSGDYKLDDYINVDAHIAYTYKMATLSFMVNNVFNEEYSTSGWATTVNPAAERNFMLMLSLKL